ncbi:MAG: aminotransferase class IV, partial [Pseudomonadota bacterium]
RSAFPDIPKNFYQQGISLGVCNYRLPSNEALAGVKHLNRLDQVLACSDWSEGDSERLMLDQRDRVIEGTMTNVFIEKNGLLKTPALQESGVEGVLREWLINNCHQVSMECRQQDIDLAQLEQADAVFMCNSVIGIWPVSKFQSRNFAISENVRQLMQLINDRLSSLYVV